MTTRKVIKKRSTKKIFMIDNIIDKMLVDNCLPVYQVQGWKRGELIAYDDLTPTAKLYAIAFDNGVKFGERVQTGVDPPAINVDIPQSGPELLREVIKEFNGMESNDEEGDEPVASILAKRQGETEIEYFVKWINSGDCSWEGESQLAKCRTMVKCFESGVKKATANNQQV